MNQPQRAQEQRSSTFWLVKCKWHADEPWLPRLRVFACDHKRTVQQPHNIQKTYHIGTRSLCIGLVLGCWVDLLLLDCWLAYILVILMLPVWECFLSDLVHVTQRWPMFQKWNKIPINHGCYAKHIVDGCSHVPGRHYQSKHLFAHRPSS